jgi:hypothetical protein
MAKTGDKKIPSALPQEVLNLIVRKLEVRRREQLELHVSANQFAYSKMDKAIMIEITARRLGRALVSIPSQKAKTGQEHGIGFGFGFRDDAANVYVPYPLSP